MASDQLFPSFSVLVVEDDKAACQVIVRMVAMKFSACTIHTAENGVQGVELFKQFSPDITIADVNMPVMDGIEMVREIRSMNTNATCIMVTAYSDKNTFEQLNDIGVCAYLLKPLDFGDLFAAIERCRAEVKLQGE